LTGIDVNRSLRIAAVEVAVARNQGTQPFDG
jgi:hypothetical protein